MNIRTILEEREEQILSSLAQKSRSTRGRARPEIPCDIRPAFQHDRDRIVHSKSFRRLKHKSQVFLFPTDDHYRTRLTHTLEVSQIARTLAKSLQLNEDLVEAISLGHDLGHTPFGHAGEAVLNSLHQGGFRHNEQSLRVVDVLEKDGQGLNLTVEVRDGILRHSKGKGDMIAKAEDERPLTQEAEIVRIADVIAYINHDIDDAIRGNVIAQSDLPATCLRFLGETHSKRIDTMVRAVIRETQKRGHPGVEPDIEGYMGELREFLYARVYENPVVHGDFEKCSRIIEDLYRYLLGHHDAFLEETGLRDFYDDAPTCVCDYVASMTDRYAFTLFEKIFLPMPWKIPV
jgi:dGTPase